MSLSFAAFDVVKEIGNRKYGLAFSIPRRSDDNSQVTPTTLSQTGALFIVT